MIFKKDNQLTRSVRWFNQPVANLTSYQGAFPPPPPHCLFSKLFMRSTRHSKPIPNDYIKLSMKLHTLRNTVASCLQPQFLCLGRVQTFRSENDLSPPLMKYSLLNWSDSFACSSSKLISYEILRPNEDSDQKKTREIIYRNETMCLLYMCTLQCKSANI